MANSELLIIRALENTLKSVWRTTVLFGDWSKGGCPIFTLIKLFVKAAMRITSDEVLSNPIVLSFGLVE